MAALVAAAIGTGGWLLMRTRSARRTWDAGYEAAVGETRWLTAELLPTLGLAEAPEAVRGGWTVAAPRVTQLEDQLSGLAATATQETGRTQATTLRDAVRESRVTLDRVTGGAMADPASVRADVQQAARRLSEALASVQPPVPPAG